MKGNESIVFVNILGEIDLLCNKFKVLCIRWVLSRVLGRQNSWIFINIFECLFLNFTKSFKSLKIHNFLLNFRNSYFINSLKFKLKNLNHNFFWRNIINHTILTYSFKILILCYAKIVWAKFISNSISLIVIHLWSLF